MATFLDVGIFEHFSIIFIFILVFIIVYAILEKTNAFGEGKRGLHAMVGFAVAALSLFSSSVLDMIRFMIPWFVIVFIIIIFVLMALRIFNASDSDFIETLKSRNEIIYWIVAVFIVIIIAAGSQTFGQNLLDPNEDGSASQGTTIEEGGTSTSTADYDENLSNTIFHPTILGLILMFFIATFAIYFLTRTPSK